MLWKKLLILVLRSNYCVQHFLNNSKIATRRYNVITNMNDKKLYIKENEVRFRKFPEITEGAKLLSQGRELEFIDGPWVKVKLGDEEGWVHYDYLTETNPGGEKITSDLPNFIIGQTNLVDNPNTIKARKIINDEFGGGRDKDYLNCTEYVQCCVKTKLGKDIQWPLKSGRNGGKWWKIFQDAGFYKILNEPKPNCAMCFTAGISIDPKINEIGHVAFIENVLQDGSVKISEANWPRSGIYNERIISKYDWQNKYEARFIEFV